MKTINPIELRSLLNEEHFQFHFGVKKLFENQTPSRLEIEEFFPRYLSAFFQEDAALQKEQGGAIPQIIMDSDALRNLLYQEFVGLQQSGLMHGEPEVREAAKRIGTVIDQFKDVRTFNYRNRSAAITNLNLEIRGKYAYELLAIEGSECLINLSDANNDFIIQFANHVHDKSVRNNINIRGARERIDPVYYDIIAQLNARAYANDNEGFNGFIDEMNYFINCYQTQLADRQARIDIRKTHKDKEHLDLSSQQNPSLF